MPPWSGGYNPWTGVVHAYTMPMPRPPVSGILGARLRAHQALYAAPQQPYAPTYGGMPSYAPSQQAGWDPALVTALQQVAPAGSSGGVPYLMDSGASSHMAAYPGNLSSLSLTSTNSRIIVGNGTSLPITHIGSAAFPSTSRPLSLNNVLVSPHLRHNLVSVKTLTRDNSITVEFDALGFSVKDARTRMVLHRCESPGDLYPVQTPPSSCSGPRALSAGVDLWHARLGHPSSTALRHIMRDFAFSCNKPAAHSCEACRLGKHVRLPFSSSSTVASFPFQLIHSDVWTSPIASNSGFLY
jgi:hypothetical protein